MRTETVTLKKDVRLIATPVTVQTEEWSPATLTSAPIPRQMELPVAAVMSPGSSLWKQRVSQTQLVLSSAQYPVPNPPVSWEHLQCWGFQFREHTEALDFMYLVISSRVLKIHKGIAFAAALLCEIMAT